MCGSRTGRGFVHGNLIHLLVVPWLVSRGGSLTTQTAFTAHCAAAALVRSGLTRHGIQKPSANNLAAGQKVSSN
eukprot:3790200-Pleurochrysis_carterae.AAC.1